MDRTTVSASMHLGLLAVCMVYPWTVQSLEPLSPAHSLPGAGAHVPGPAPTELARVPTAPIPNIGRTAAPEFRNESSEVGTPFFLLREVRFEGGEGLPQAGLDTVWSAYRGRWMSLSDLEQLRYELTRHFVDLGYINSGVLVKPGQTISDGMLTFQIVTGRLTEVRISGNRGLRPAYLWDRIWPDPDEPLNQSLLQQRFQLLLDDPLIERIDGTLLPGLSPGSAMLDLEVVRARSWDLYARVDNYHPPSTGAEFFYLGGALRNLTGLGDVLEFYGGLGLQGDNELQDRGYEGSIGWSVPVTARDTRIFARYDWTNASLLEEPLSDLDIKSDTERFEIGASHPFWRTPRSALNLGLLFGWSRNTTTLLGERFSFSPGAVRGESRVTAVRLYQEYLDRKSASALALRSVFSLGVDALDATTHGSGLPDSQFFVWLGQAQYVRNLDWQETQLVLRAAVQLTPDVLLPLERYAVGGANTVRGYRENELVGDAGYAGSLELRYPLWRGALWGGKESLLQLAVFTDFGSAWTHGEFDRREDLFSVGVGARWHISERLRAELYLAHAFSEPVPKDTYDWQDNGIHFMLETQL